MTASSDMARALHAGPAAHLAPRFPLEPDDGLQLSPAMSGGELRALAAHWRAGPDAEDGERAERVARILEWLANLREPQPPRTRLQAIGERISGWVGL